MLFFICGPPRTPHSRPPPLPIGLRPPRSCHSYMKMQKKCFITSLFLFSNLPRIRKIKKKKLCLKIKEKNWHRFSNFYMERRQTKFKRLKYRRNFFFMTHIPPNQKTGPKILWRPLRPHVTDWRLLYNPRLSQYLRPSSPGPCLWVSKHSWPIPQVTRHLATPFSYLRLLRPSLITFWRTGAVLVAR